MTTAKSIQNLKDSLSHSQRMPVVFLGHGSPMNALEENQFSQSWKALGQVLPKPQAILMISAHWTTRGKTLVDASIKPKTIHDFYGFPQALSTFSYPAEGQPSIAKDVASLLQHHHASTDTSWGLDHGAWSVLAWLYPEADVPVLQLSIDINESMHSHLDIGQQLAPLRDKGVLIIGSGNIVHNLQALSNQAKPHDWAEEFDRIFEQKLLDRDFGALANTSALGNVFNLAHPTVEHYLPALSIAGASLPTDSLTTVTQGFDLGAISMRSFIYH